jgi:hypothetical protein
MNEPTSGLLSGGTSYDPKSDGRRGRRSQASETLQRGRVPTAAHSGLRILSLLFSLTIIGILSYTLILYHRTKDENITSAHGYRFRAWPTLPKLHPIYLLLAAAAFAAALNIGVLLALLCGVSYATQIKNPQLP